MNSPSLLFSSFSRSRSVAALVLFGFWASIGNALAQSSTMGTGVVRHAVMIGGSNRVEGSLQLLSGESSSLTGNAIVTGDLLVPGIPAIQFSGNPNYGGTLQGTGPAQPSNYVILGQGSFSLRHIVLRTNPITSPVVAAPPAPAGTRDVTLSGAADSAGNFATLRNLTVGGSAGNVVVPPGTYGAFSVSGKNSLTLGIPGATQPAIYNFQRLVFSGNDDLRIVGPVVITVNGSVICGGRIGSSANPGWLKLRLASGDLTLSGNNTIYGELIVPNGTVHFNGNSELIGGLFCNQLILDGNNLLRFLVLNTAPSASNALVTTNEDTSVPIVLSAADPDGNSLSYILLSLPTHGTLSGNLPQLTFTPDANYFGSDSFTFKANDGQVDSNVATVSISVTPVNDPPVANSQTLTTEEDIILGVTLSGHDVEGSVLSYRIVSSAAHGTLSGTPPQLIYTPAPNYNGTDSFTFVANDGAADSALATVTINVGPVNDPPVAFNQSVSVDEDTGLPVLLSGTDLDGDALTYSVVTMPRHGSLAGTPPNLTYTPELNYNGPDSFSYRVSDGVEDSAVAHVLIAVRPVNDAPTAADQNVSTTEDTERPITLGGEDVDGDPITFTIVLPPAHGTITGSPPNVVYTPARDYNGADTFSFKTNDGLLDSQVATIGITVTPVNDPPVAAGQSLTTDEDTSLAITVFASDAEDDALSYILVHPPQHGQLSGTAPNLLYTPAANYNGPDSFSFKARDGAADSEVVSVQITVVPVNDAPTADNQSVTTEEDTAREILLTGADLDSPALTFRIVANPSHGAISGTAPLLTYTPAANYFGPDSFTFVANDGEADSQPATVSIDVGAVNDAPVTYNQNVATDEDTSLNIALWADDYDGDPVTFRVVALPQHGTISGANGDLTYTPDLNYNGLDSFAYKANDGQEDSNVSIVTIAVRPVNDPPIAGAQNRLMAEDTILPVTLTAADVDNDPLTYSIVASPAHGTLSGTPPSLTYTPAANFNGPDSFTFIANDGTVDSSVAMVSITVQPVNDLPVGDNHTASTDEDTPLSITLSGSDVDGDSLTYFIVSSPQHGTVSGTPPQITYTPSRDYNGLDRIVFAINDGTSDSLPAEIQIVVRPVNDPPVVDAGPDQSITFPGIASLAGKAKDDGDPAGSTVSVTWTQVSGPGAVTFQAANALETRAAFSVAGVYVLRLSASDSELSSSDDITITVSPENHRPEVNAGPDQLVTLPGAALLQGTVTDDGNPAGKTLITAWSVISAPASVSFSDRNNPRTTVSFSTVGTYILRLTASDTELSKGDNVTITVLPHNNPPVVNAGGNKSVELTDTLALTGTVTDDGLPAGGNLTVSWTVLSGPGDTTIANPAAAATTAKFTKPGAYVLRISANDSQLSASDQITVTVIQTNRPPTVDAGADQTLNLYNIAELRGTVTDDGLPNNTISLSWTKVSGPGDVAFSAASASTTTATFSKPGTYTVRLTADDSALTASDEVVIAANFKNQAPKVDAGPDRNGTVHTSIALDGTVSDDGLPVGAPVTVSWTKVSGSGTVSFGNASAAATSASFSATGTYVLRLTASDSDVSGSDEVTVTIGAAANQPPVVNAGPSQILRASAPTITPPAPPGPVSPITMTVLNGFFRGVTGITYHQPTGGILCSVNFPDGAGQNFVMFSPDGTTRQWTSLAGLTDELKVDSARAEVGGKSIGGFLAGETFFGGVDAGWINRISPDGQIVTLGWAKLPNESGQHVTSVHFDRTGVWGGDLIAATLSGNVWRINHDGVATFVGSTHVWTEGVTTVPNIPERYGPWAGKILVAAEQNESVFSLDAQGHLVQYNFGIDELEDVLYLEPGENLFVTDQQNGKVMGATAAQLNNMAGDIIIGQEFVGKIYNVRWNGSSFVVTQITQSLTGDLEFMACAPAALGPVPASPQQWVTALNGSATDDGLPTGSHLTTTWRQLGGPANATIYGPDKLITQLGLEQPGTYIFELRASDSELEGADTVTIAALPANQVPVVNAGPDVEIASTGNTAHLAGTVSDDGVTASGQPIAVSWSMLAGPGQAVFADPASADTTVTFSVSGIYVVQLTADDGFGPVSDVAVVRVASPCSGALPQGIVAWWPANGDAVDIIGGHDAALQNGVNFGPGKVGLGFKFDGVSNRVFVPRSPALDVGTGNGMTVDFWVKPDSVNRWQMLMEWGTQSAQGVHFWITGDSPGSLWVNLIDTNGSGHFFASSNTALVAGQFQHIAVTYDRTSGVCQVYRDGIVIDERNLGIFTPQTSYDLQFGFTQRDPRGFGGIMDEPSIYNRVLTTEIPQIYAAGAIGKCPPGPNVPPTVDAGPDQSVASTAFPVQLNGFVTDDGRPIGQPLQISWSMVDGPGHVTFSDITSASTTASFDTPGIYILRLAASDSAALSSDTVEVRVATVCAVAPPAGMVAWWPGNGNGREIINGNDAQLLYNVSFAAGKVSLGFNFDGNDELFVPRNSALNFGPATGALTLEFWIQPTYLNRWQSIFEWGTKTELGAHVFINGDSPGCFWINLRDTNGSDHGFTTVSVLQTGQLQHIAITYDRASGRCQIYRNGVMAQERDLGSFTPRTDFDIHIGHTVRDPRPFYGVMDEIGLYNRVLGSEITDIYNAGAVGKCPPSQNTPPYVRAGQAVHIDDPAQAVSLQGYVADDGLPNGSLLVSQWSVVSGPGRVTFGNTAAPATTASFSSAGIYLLRLTANDGEFSSSDTVEVHVATSCAAAPAGLIAWWPGNGNGRDLVNSNDAQLLSNVTFVPAEVSLGFNFDGSDELFVPRSSALNIGPVNGALTWEFWIKPTYLDRWQSIFEWGTKTQLGAHLFIDGNNPGCFWVNLIDTNGSDHGFTTAQVLQTAQLQHIVIAYDRASGHCRIYRNGALAQDRDLGSFTPRTDFDVHIGHTVRDPRPFYGVMDEIGVYNRALTASEASTLYQTGGAGKCPSFNGNQAPYVFAGLPQTIMLPGTVSLAGVVHDDGLPVAGTTTVAWSQVSGPGSVIFSAPDNIQTTAQFSAPGTYVLRLVATDSALTSSDDVAITVVPAGAVNQPPTITVSSSFSGDVSNPVNLTAVAQDDGLPVGSTLTVRWTEISGPGSVTFDNSARATTAVHFTVAGNYLLRISASDLQYTVNRDVTVTILPAQPTNVPPTVSAGPNHSILLGQSVQLVGTVSDDGLPTNAPVTVHWTQVAGPGTATFQPPDNSTTTVTFNQVGTYTLRLTASDSLLSSSSDVTVTVYPSANAAPIVNAGANQTVTIGAGASLHGSVSDDGLPSGAPVTSQWQKVSGPGTVTFSNPTSLNTGVQFGGIGTYVLALVATDTEMTATSEVTIQVTDGSNQPPTVDAGPDQTISIHDVAILNGIGDDDGLPQGTLYFRWSLVSGPGSINFNNNNGVVSVSFSTPGTYVLRLFVSDSQLTASDDMVVTVYGDNQAPVVSAGGNQSIRSGNSAALNGSVTDDGLPLGSTVSSTWSKVSGPGNVSFGNVHLPATSAAFDQPGTYVLQLSATDGALTSNSTTSVFVTSAANVPPTVSITAPADGTNALANHSVFINANAADSDGTVSNVAFYVNGAKIGESAAPFSFAWSGGPAGDYTLTAVATDNEKAAGSSAPVHLHVVDASNAQPVVEIVSPLEGDTITGPTPVIGTVDSPILQSYVLQYRLKDQVCAQWVTFATGYTSVLNASLGTLDTTLLRNGIYEIQLIVNGLNGASYALSESIVVDGNMKVGHFSVAFNDLQIPLAGIPITVTRAYDSRETCNGDFGVGWNIDVDSVRLQKNYALGDMWFADVEPPPDGNPFVIPIYSILDDGPHVITINFPDGKTYRFRPVLKLKATGAPLTRPYVPYGTDDAISMTFEALPGTHGQLIGRGVPASLYLEDGSYQAPTRFLSTPQDFDTDFADATGFDFVTQDGRTFTFDAQGKLTRMTDRLGNSVTFQHNGIFHSSGKNIQFVRDGDDRIKQIIDPNGATLNYQYDAAGDLVAFFDRTVDPLVGPATATFNYAGGSHYLTGIFDSRGIQGIKNFYDADGRLYETDDADGNQTVITHDLDHRKEVIRDRNGNTTTHEYDERGNITLTINAKGEQTAYAYHVWSDGTKSDLKETETVTGLFSDGNGGTTTKSLSTHYSYERDDGSPPLNDGLLRKVVDPLGHATTFTYNATGQVLTMTDARQNAGGGSPAPSVSNTYFADGNLQTTQDGLGNVTSYTYDANGNRHTETRTVTVNGNTQTLVTTTNYDPTGFLLQTIDPVGHVTNFLPDANNNVLKETTSRTDSNGATVAVVTEHQYDEQDRLIRTWNAENPRQSASAPSSETVYNTLGKAEFVYDALRHVTHNEYDDRGYLAKVTYPDGNFELTSYDKEGRRQFFTDRAGRKTQYHYDVVGRLDQTIFLGTGANPPVTLSTSTFDAAGRVIISTDANGNPTTSIYDDAGRRVGMLNAKSELSRFGYDANGNQTSFTDALNRTITYGYDALNRRTSTLFPPSEVDVNGTLVTTATETVTAYDELGRRVVEYQQSPQGTLLAQRPSKRFVYDALGRLTDVIDTAGQDTHYSYDELGNQLTQRDANQHTTTYGYDSLGRRLSRTLPMGQSELNTYDAAGNLRFRKDFNGNTTEYRYDALNRLLNKLPSASLGNPSVGYTYTPTGKRGSMSDATGRTTYGYTERDQLKTKATPFGTLSYSYYPPGSLSGMQSSNANDVSVGYRYDALNRLEYVDDQNTGTTSYVYDAVGNLDHFAYPNGVQHVYGYDALNRLKGLGVYNSGQTLLAGYAYAVAPVGQRTSVQENNGRTVNYTYDNLHRLTGEAIAGAPGINGVIGYVYDNVGNRLSRTSSVAGISSQSFGYDANDRLTSDTYDNNGNTRLGHLDGNAQPVSDTYDFENRLVSRNNGAVQITYDGDGNKVRETANGHTVTYLIDDQNPTGYAQVLEQLTDGVVSRVYTFGHDLLSEDQLISGNWSSSFYGYDGHGSVRLLTNNLGQVTDTYTYDAFGQLIQSAGTTPNDYRYSGEQLDPNLGFYYLRARYLNAANGRFWTRDSCEGRNADPLSLHKYFYANADPVSSIDPSGHETLAEVSVASALSNALASLATSAAVTGFIVNQIDLALEAVGSRSIDGFVAEHQVFGLTQDDFDDLSARISRTKTSRRYRSVYLHYSFDYHAPSLLGLGLLPGSFATKTVFPTGWEAKRALALPQREIQNAIYVVWPRAFFEPTGPTSVSGTTDLEGRVLPGGGEQWVFEKGSGGPGTVFGPIPLPPGSP